MLYLVSRRDRLWTCQSILRMSDMGLHSGFIRSSEDKYKAENENTVIPKTGPPHAAEVIDTAKCKLI